jgi:hypothetical protein
MLSSKIFHMALQWLFSGSKLPFYVTTGAGTICFFVHHFVPLLARLRIFLDQLRLAVPPRGGGAPHLQPCALLRSSRRTNQNFRLLA